MSESDHRNQTDQVTSESRKARAERMFDTYLGILEDILAGRSPVLDRDGRGLTDEHGRPVFELPSASHLKRAAEIFERLGIGVDMNTSKRAKDFVANAPDNWKVGGRKVDIGRLPPDDVEAM